MHAQTRPPHVTPSEIAMHAYRFALASLLLAMPAIQGCSRPAATPATADTTAAADETAAATPVPQSAKACDMVTSAEMSAILGSAVVGTPHNDGNKTECIYKPADAVSPYVEFSVAWGDGEAAMGAVGMMGHIEPGMADPYAGLGDQAASIGPALMIRTGDDLVELTFSGVADIPAAAKKIFDTAKPRM
jgi:hypothetical protein